MYPLLYLVLLSEFLIKISEKFIIYKGICRSVIKNLILLAQNIEDSITEELELKYFLCCTDRKSRTVLTIIAMNSLYSLLNNNDLGSIVSNL